MLQLRMLIFKFCAIYNYMYFKNWLINEQSGWKLIAYHRTRQPIDAVNKFTLGFDNPRNIGDYGPGIYLFINKKTIERPDVIDKYGEVVIKAYCDLHGFLILEPSLAKSLYGTSSLVEQLKIILNLKVLPSKLEQGISAFENTTKGNDFSHEIQAHPEYKRQGNQALPYMLGVHKNQFNKLHDYKSWDGSKFMHPYALLRNLNLIDKIKGIYLYANTSTTRDWIIVSYNKNNISPIAYASVSNNESIDNVKWTPLNPKEFFKNRTSSPSIVGKPEIAPEIKSSSFKVGDEVYDKSDIRINKRDPSYELKKLKITGISANQQEIYLKSIDGHSYVTNVDNIEKQIF